MKAYMDLFFVNPENLPRGLPHCENDRGMITWLREVYRDQEHLEEEVESFLERAHGYYNRMGTVEEVWMSLSIYTSDQVNPAIHLTKQSLGLLVQMNASLDFDIYAA